MRIKPPFGVYTKKETSKKKKIRKFRYKVDLKRLFLEKSYLKHQKLQLLWLENETETFQIRQTKRYSYMGVTPERGPTLNIFFKELDYPMRLLMSNSTGFGWKLEQKDSRGNISWGEEGVSLWWWVKHLKVDLH